jgi:hypothetical protein
VQDAVGDARVGRRRRPLERAPARRRRLPELDRVAAGVVHREATPGFPANDPFRHVHTP